MIASPQDRGLPVVRAPRRKKKLMASGGGGSGIGFHIRITLVTTTGSCSRSYYHRLKKWAKIQVITVVPASQAQ
jgi:hypothetical protein